MPKKHEEINNPKSSLNKADPEEQIFTLRGQDVSTPRTIMFWLMENIMTAPEEKLRRAFETALRARGQGVKSAD